MMGRPFKPEPGLARRLPRLRSRAAVVGAASRARGRGDPRRSAVREVAGRARSQDVAHFVQRARASSRDPVPSKKKRKSSKSKWRKWREIHKAFLHMGLSVTPTLSFSCHVFSLIREGLL